MHLTALLGIFFRWLHVSTAAVAIGGVFFMRVVVPIGLSGLDPDSRHKVMLRLRRGLKMVIHPCILLFLISGIYNVCIGWYRYSVPGVRPLGQALIGTHMLLAVIVFTISLILLAGAEPKPWAKTGMTLNLILLFLTIGAASAVKWVREHPKPTRAHAAIAAADLQTGGK